MAEGPRSRWPVMDQSGRLKDLNAADIAIAGASSGFLARAVVQPFDVLKIRFQLQVEPVKRNAVSKYQSIPQAVGLIYREEGIKAFWKGHVPAQMLSISFGLVQFWLFETLIKEFKKEPKNEYTIIKNFSCGAVAGTAATIVSFPFDIMRTRLIAQSYDNVVYESIWKGYIHMVRNEGYLSIYKGLTPTIIAVAPNAGLQFMFYNVFDKLYRNYIKLGKDSYSFIGSMFAGSMAGFLSKSMLYPLDLARKRMQVQGFQQHRESFGASFICIGLANCLVQIYRVEGSLGWFKGMSPSVLKGIVATSLNFTAFESVCSFLSYIHSM